MFTPLDRELERGWPGRIEGDRVIQLAAQTLQAFFAGGGGAREHAEYQLDEVRLLAPVLQPPALRLVEAFGASGSAPLFAFGNPASIVGPEVEVPHPDGVRELDFGLGVAAMIGGEGGIAGFTILNDWTALDLEREERAAGVGPGKSRDFATSLGPVVVTPDELGEGRLDLVARVNGEERARGNLDELSHGWKAILEHVARGTELRPGDLLAAGSLRGGRPLEPGDIVELEVERVGVLRNPVGGQVLHFDKVSDATSPSRIEPGSEGER